MPYMLARFGTGMIFFLSFFLHKLCINIFIMHSVWNNKLFYHTCAIGVETQHGMDKPVFYMFISYNILTIKLKSLRNAE